MTAPDLYAGLLEQGILMALLRDPQVFRFEAATLDPRLFRWHPAHREIAVALRRLADAGRLAHWRRVRRALRTEGAADLVNELVHIGGTNGNVTGAVAELQRLRRAGTRRRAPARPQPNRRANR